ncbi:DUF5597 domain-containing protein [Leifsonia xyli]|uniref:DUF5597 domain-containing protein n=1 Tax=Leifsonia xyli TaxID=1575 RepID=UPI0007D077BF
MTASLVVDGRPFLAIGGEVHNSSSSDAAYLATEWGRLARTGINTVLVSVAWSEVERAEGEFSFEIVDELLRCARDAGLRLGAIWFGAFKNALSTYAPSWVRADTDRFPRTIPQRDPLPTPFNYDGATAKPALSVFSPELAAADARAFTAFVEHLAMVDDTGTVIMIQIENEIGLLGSSRDHSELAAAAWRGPVPAALIALAHEEPEALPAGLAAALADSAQGVTWASLAGSEDDIDETFMAWAFAEYVERLAMSARPATHVPFYTNAWLGPQAGQDRPGQYPSGGPTARMLGLWQAAAPSLDWLSPDIYIDDTRAVLEAYAQRSNPLFVPESRFSAGDLFVAVGALNAIGYCTFGLEDGRDDALFFRAARSLLALWDLITTQRDSAGVWGFALDADEESARHDFGDVTVTVRNGPALFARMLLDVGVQLPEPAPPASETLPGAIPVPADSRPFGIVIRTGADQFVVAGQGALFDFDSENGLVEIDEVRELIPEGGTLRPARFLNGDECLEVVPQSGIGIAEITLVRPVPAPIGVSA